MTLKPYPAYKPSGVEWLGEIPESWSIDPIRRRARLRTEKAGYSERKVGLENIEPWTGRFIEVESADYSGEGVAFREGDVLFGKLRPYLAKAWRADSAGAAVGDFHVYALSREVQPRFFLYVVLSVDFISLVNGSTYGAKMPRASWDFIGNLALVFPSVYEQRQIADYLDVQTARIDALIAMQERLIETLAERRRAVVNHAVTKGIDPNAPIRDTGIEIIGAVPAHWKALPLKRLIFKIEQGVSPQASAELADDASWGVVKSGCVNHGVFSDLQHKRLSEDFAFDPSIAIQPGDLLVSRASGSPSLVGSAAIVRQLRYRLILSDKTFRIKVKPTESAEFLEQVMNSRVFRDQVRGAISGAEGLANNLPSSSLKQFVIPVPPREEQLAIVRYLRRETSQIDALSAKAREMIDVLKERRQALISAAVTGKIDVRGLA